MPDSTQIVPVDSLTIQDTIPPVPQERIMPGTTPQREVVVSPDAFDGAIEWGSQDTMWFDKQHNKVHLYGSAYVNYDQLKLKAGYIAFDFDKNEALAMPLVDEQGNELEPPEFDDGNQTFKAGKLRYNFKSSKGMVYDVVKKEGELYVHGGVTKYISRDADTINHVETIYAKDGIITSCDADHPHFGIRAKKLKVVPNKLAVLGFSMLEIADIPTPLVLPFGFYPMFKDQRSGLILPNDYVFDQRLGYGLSGIGLYFPISDYYDLKILGDIYTRGSWGLNISSNYKKRYKYSGSVSLSYFNARTEKAGQLEKLSDHKFSIRLSHSQDPKANPYQRLGGSINFSLNGYDKTFNTDAATQLNNITSSNLNYSHDMPGTIFKFSAGLQHSQNTSSNKISITFPVAKLTMSSYYPFKSKKSGGKENWYEKINIRYSADAKNMIDATDSTLFTRQTIENARYGLKHGMTGNASFNLMKYFTVTPSIKYNEVYYFKEQAVSLDPTMSFDTVSIDVDGNPLRIDTTFGQVVFDTTNTFKPFRDFSSSVSMSTKMYGKMLFNKGWLRGLRHQISYNMGFTYSPNTQQFYEVELDTDSREEYENLRRYDLFVNNAYSINPRIKQMTLSYNINNVIEGKFFSRKDSSVNKVSLIPTFKISGNYNFAKDTLKFSQIRLTANTYLFKRKLSIRYNGTLDPYIEQNGTRVNTYVWEDSKRPFRHVVSTLDVSTGITIRELVEAFTDKPEKEGNKGDGFVQQESGLLDLIGSFRIKYDLGMTWKLVDGRDTIYVDRHVLSTQGSIKLSKNWNLRVGHIGYDLLAKKITYPDLGFERNLHCWTMNFSWRPSAGQYTFYIGVRSSTLDFLKYRHGQSALETSLGGF